MPNNIIIIAGPTASGKSNLALDVALEIDGEIINADSMQVYKDTPILSACPNTEDKALVPHHLYEIYDSSIHGNVVDWLNLAVKKIQEIWQKGKTPIIVGGTGMYIDNLLNGTTPIPSIDPKIREEVANISNAYDKLDAKAQKILSANDTTRTKRALEVLIQTGESIIDWHQKPLNKMIEADFIVIKILPEKKELDQRCDLRFDKMIELGALDEIKKFQTLNISPNLPATKALGVPELLDFLAGNIPLEKAIDLAKIHSHQYAKRQLTWFNNKLKADLTINECYKQQKKHVKTIIDLQKKTLGVKR